MDVRNITVLGSGVMGHGIAQISAAAGYEVVLRDIRQDLLDAAMEKIKWSLDKMASKGRITAEQGDEIFGRIRPVVDLAEAAGSADLVVEVVPEIMDIKRKVYAELDGVAAEGAIFASNTSTLPITEIAAATSRPERFIGIHFFNPPQLMKLVEIIPGERTDSGVVETARKYVSSLGKETVLCRRDVPGFIVNRLFIPLVHEACYAMERTGASPAQIDSAARSAMGLPMGVFELADFTGMDVIHKATEEMHMRDKKVVRPHPTVGRMFEEGRLGQKSGEGFFKYSGKKYERTEGSDDGGFDPVHLIANVANNAAWLVTNGASDADELEGAAKLGLGLRKPVFEAARDAGIGRIISELEGLAREHGPFYEPDPLLRSMA